MPKFLMQAEVNCGVTYEVDAKDEQEAHRIMEAAMLHHIENGCDGVSTYTVSDLADPDIDTGVRIGKDSTGQPYPVPVSSGLEFYERG